MPVPSVQAQLAVGVAVFRGLQVDEQEAEQEGGGQEDVEHAAVAGAQRVVRDGHGDAGRSRMMVLSAGRPKAGMISKVPSSRGPSFAGPLVGQAFSNSGCSSSLPMTLVPSPPSHGTDSDARVEQRAEERGEEHHLGEDEPHHSHAERAVDVQAVDAALVLADDVPNQPMNMYTTSAKPGQHRPGRRPVVEQRDRAQQQREERRRGDDRPLARVGDVVLFAGVGVCV